LRGHDEEDEEEEVKDDSENMEGGGEEEEVEAFGLEAAVVVDVAGVEEEAAADALDEQLGQTLDVQETRKQGSGSIPDDVPSALSPSAAALPAGSPFCLSVPVLVGLAMVTVAAAAAAAGMGTEAGAGGDGAAFCLNGGGDDEEGVDVGVSVPQSFNSRRARI
jgi:translation elongation factor EF-1beta